MGAADVSKQGRGVSTYAHVLLETHHSENPICPEALGPNVLRSDLWEAPFCETLLWQHTESHTAGRQSG